jgi:hypothetical protein
MGFRLREGKKVKKPPLNVGRIRPLPESFGAKTK